MPAGDNLHPIRLRSLSTLSSGRKAANKNAVVPTACHSYSFLNSKKRRVVVLNRGAEVCEGRCQNKQKKKKNEDTEMLQRVPPCSRLKLSDKERATSRHGGRRTCSIQRTLIPSPILLHTPTMRTLHIAQIVRESYKKKQLVCLRAFSSSSSSSGTGAFSLFFSFSLP